MNMFHIFPMMVLLTSASLSSSAADLAHIDRDIAREPSYSAKPKYCLLAFGLKAQTRVWLVLDGQTLHIDRNGNGDLTENGEAVKGRAGRFDGGFVTAVDGVAPNTRLELLFAGGLTFVYCHTEGKRWQRAVVDSAGKLEFGNTRRTAPVVHFNGPLTLARRFSEPFRRGAVPTELHVMVGTPGVGAGTFARFAHDGISEDAHPVAQIGSPGNGTRPEMLTVVLERRC